jgi:dephospho-CoA kinase
VTAGVRALRVGLTGGIGSGKSTAAQVLAAGGACLIDSDAIARALTQAGGAAMPALAAAFGAEAVAPDGALAREHMRRLAFADAGAKARLEAILHPLIGAEAQRQAAAAAGRPLVFDVPLLAESRHWRARVDRVLVIDCTEATQVARVAARPGWSEEAALRVVSQQAPRARRRAVADAVIFNDGLALPDFESEVRAVWALWSDSAHTG